MRYNDEHYSTNVDFLLKCLLFLLKMLDAVGVASSFWMQNSSFLTHNSSFLIHNSSCVNARWSRRQSSVRLYILIFTVFRLCFTVFDCFATVLRLIYDWFGPILNSLTGGLVREDAVHALLIHCRGVANCNININFLWNFLLKMQRWRGIAPEKW